MSLGQRLMSDEAMCFVVGNDRFDGWTGEASSAGQFTDSKHTVIADHANARGGISLAKSEHLTFVVSGQGHDNSSLTP